MWRKKGVDGRRSGEKRFNFSLKNESNKVKEREERVDNDHLTHPFWNFSFFLFFFFLFLFSFFFFLFSHFKLVPGYVTTNFFPSRKKSPVPSSTQSDCLSPVTAPGASPWQKGNKKKKKNNLSSFPLLFLSSSPFLPSFLPPPLKRVHSGRDSRHDGSTFTQCSIQLVTTSLVRRGGKGEREKKNLFIRGRVWESNREALGGQSNS